MDQTQTLFLPHPPPPPVQQQILFSLHPSVPLDWGPMAPWRHMPHKAITSTHIKAHSLLILFYLLSSNLCSTLNSLLVLIPIWCLLPFFGILIHPTHLVFALLFFPVLLYLHLLECSTSKPGKGKHKLCFTSCQNYALKFSVRGGIFKIHMLRALQWQMKLEVAGQGT